MSAVTTNPTLSWEAIGMELCKAEQMGQQTVLQFAKVGQLLIEQMGDQPIREFVQRAGQAIPRLTRSSCHNYMTLARNLPLLEQKQPDSQRAALALIAEAKRPAPLAAAAPANDAEARARAAEKRLNTIPDEFNLSAPMRERYEKAVAKAVAEVFAERDAQVHEKVEAELAIRFATERARLEEAAAEYRLQVDALSIERERVERQITAEEFSLIRNCLHPDRAPEDRKDRFDKAFTAFNKLAPIYDAMAAAEKRSQATSARMKAMWGARKAANAKAEVTQ